MAPSAPIDSKVSAILERNNPAIETDLDADAILDELEQEDDTAYRAHRMEQLHSELSAAKDALRSAQPGSSAATGLVHHTLYPTLTTDQALLDFTTENARCVVHFSHPDFGRCAVMDTHLSAIAGRHYDVRFARVDVRNVPFVVEKLNIRVLPCIIGFRDGQGKERILGFEGLGTGGKDAEAQIRTGTLERKLLKMGVLMQEKIGDGAGLAYGGGEESESEDEEDTGGRRQGNYIGGKGGRRGKAQKDSDDDDDWD